VGSEDIQVTVSRMPANLESSIQLWFKTQTIQLEAMEKWFFVFRKRLFSFEVPGTKGLRVWKKSEGPLEKGLVSEFSTRKF
jgi:hypothetical protein